MKKLFSWFSHCIQMFEPFTDFPLNIFQVMSMFATAEHEKERLQYFVSPEGRDDLYQYNQRERRTVLEVRSNQVMNSFAFSVFCLSIMTFTF